MKYLAQIDFNNFKIPVGTDVTPAIKINELFSGGVGKIISALLPILFTFAGLLLLLYLLFGGISLMTSGGDPKSVASAKAKITNAFIGFILVFVAYWVVALLGKILGITVFTSIFGGL